MATLIRGFVDKFPDRSPPKSSKGFEWPGKFPTDEQRAAFKKNFTAHVRAKAANHREFARLFYGEIKTASGYTAPRNPNTIMNYADGDQFPTEDQARKIAAFLKVPLDSFLIDDGKPFEPLPLIRPKRATAKRRKANGHSGNGAAAAAGHEGNGAPASGARHDPPPLAPRPESSAPATLHVDSIPGAPDYCNVAISGTVRYDTAMALVNLIGRDLHGLGPRK